MELNKEDKKKIMDVLMKKIENASSKELQEALEYMDEVVFEKKTLSDYIESMKQGEVYLQAKRKAKEIFGDKLT